MSWLTHWWRVTHICVGKLTIIGSDNDLSPGRCQAIIWTNAAILLIWTLSNKLQWKFNYNWNIFIKKNAFENVVWEMSAILSRPQCVNHILTVPDCVCLIPWAIAWTFEFIHMQELLDPVVSCNEQVKPRLVELPIKFAAYLTQVHSTL